MIGALALASLCTTCIAIRAGVPVLTVAAELVQMNMARHRRGRPPLGPFDGHCQRCEAAAPVYRLR